MKNSGLIILGVLVLLGIWAYTQYNGMVDTDVDVKKSWADVENQYERRADLIPNLVNTVQGAANFEKGTLTDVIEARAKATQVKVDPSNMSPDQIKEYMGAQGELSSALSRLMVTVERYPTLTATQGFRDLQVQLEGTENRITTARKDYNGVVSVFNKQVRKFPANLFAKAFGFNERPEFEARDGAEKAPEVKFEG